MTGLAQRVERMIVERRLLDDGDAALVAVSGGVDSMLLLRVLHTLRRKHRWTLVAAHFNHQLRGRAAREDQQFVARAARRFKLRFESASADVKAFARANKLSVEMAARHLRHDFLARTARALGLRKIITAHHADDQVELFFLRLFRGAGAQGLSGMDWLSPSPADQTVTLVRPLLAERKAALLAFARQNKIAFREDSTNRSTALARNRIRRQLLPLLRQHYQASVDDVVLRSMELIRAEAEFVTVEAMAWLENKARTFSQLPLAAQRRVLQLELLRAGITPQFEQIEQLRVRPDEWIAVRADLVCRRQRTGEIEVKPNGAAEFQTDESLLDLEAAGAVTAGGVQLSWRLMRRRPRTQPRHTEFFDADAVGRRIVVRHWQPGDRLQPIGLPRPVKLQDLFVNRKIPREQRHRLVVATAERGDIFWVEGLRIGERFKITPRTRRILKWSWRR